MADKWQPVVGGRAMLPSGAPCVILGLGPGGMCWYVPFPWAGCVQTKVHSGRLTEHPDDARHRRLLEAARRVSMAMGLEEFSDALIALRAIIAEHDTAEADHA